MREADNIRAVEALGVDWMGFIFWPESKRFCNRKPDYLPTRCKRVGVFVNADVADVVRYAVEYGLNIVQLHGDENRQYIMQMRQALAAAGVKCAVIKALAIKSAADIAQCENYVGFVDYFLFDTPTDGRGGSGKSFDWTLLADNYRLMTPFLLSGGIGPESASAIKEFNHPCCEGIDLNSRFESAPGRKDVGKLREFIVETFSPALPLNGEGAGDTIG